MSKLFPLLALLLATGLIAAGCGGDDDDDGDDSTTSSTSTTTGATGASGATGESDSKVVAEVNQICKDTDKDVSAAFGKSDEDGIKEIGDVLDQIKAVDGAEDDPGVSAFIDQAEKDLDALEKDPESLGSDPFTDTDKAAEAAGLTDCVG